MRKLGNLIIYLIVTAAFLSSAFLMAPVYGMAFWCFLFTIEGGITLLFLLSFIGDWGKFPVSIRYAMLLPPMIFMIVEAILFLKLGLWAQLFPRIYGALHIILWAVLIVAELVLGKGVSYNSSQDRIDAARRAGREGEPQQHITRTTLTRHNVKEPERLNRLNGKHHTKEGN